MCEFEIHRLKMSQKKKNRRKLAMSACTNKYIYVKCVMYIFIRIYGFYVYSLYIYLSTNVCLYPRKLEIFGGWIKCRRCFLHIKYRIYILDAIYKENLLKGCLYIYS